MKFFQSVEALIVGVTSEGVTEVSLNFLEVIQEDPIRKLQEIIRLSDFLKTNTSITTLLIGYNALGEEGGKAIGEALKTDVATLFRTSSLR